MTASPAFATGSGTSSNVSASGPPGVWTRTAFMDDLPVSDRRTRSGADYTWRATFWSSPPATPWSRSSLATTRSPGPIAETLGSWPGRPRSRGTLLKRRQLADEIRIETDRADRAGGVDGADDAVPVDDEDRLRRVVKAVPLEVGGGRRGCFPAQHEIARRGRRARNEAPHPRDEIGLTHANPVRLVHDSLGITEVGEGELKFPVVQPSLLGSVVRELEDLPVVFLDLWIALAQLRHVPSAERSEEAL